MIVNRCEHAILTHKKKMYQLLAWLMDSVSQNQRINQ